MKRVYIFIFLANCILLNAQKVDMDSKTMSISHTYFPTSTLLTPFKTYQVRISEPAGFLAKFGLNRVTVSESRVNIQGYQKIESGGEFIVDIIIDGLQNTENKRMTNASNDKSGKTKTSYYHRVVFYVPVTVRIVDANQKTIATQEIRNSKNLQEWNSNVYSSNSELDKRLDGEKQQLNKLVTTYLENAFADISNKLTKQYGYWEDKERVTFYELDSPHPMFETYKTQIDLMEKEFQSYKPGMNVIEARQNMKPALDFFTNLVSTLNKDDKQQKKLLKHTLINLFLLYFYLDDYNNFKKYGDAFTLLEEDEAWEDSKLINADDFYKSMKACGATSLYFLRDLSAAKPSALNPVLEEKQNIPQEEIKANTQEIDLSRLKRNPTDRVLPGSHTDKNHQKIQGYFVITTEDDDGLKFASSPNVNFVYMDEQGTPRTKPITPKTIDSFNIGQRQFVVIDYKATGTLGGKSASLAEVLADHPQIKLFKYYPDSGGLTEAEDYAYVFMKPDKSTISFTGKDLFWKKKAREYFAGCQPILDEIEKMKLVSPTKNTSMNWIKFYLECNPR